MAITKINIEEMMIMSKYLPIFDVRSPGEYNHAHIPGAIGLPLFSDDERAIVGTAYKQQSRTSAIKLGLDFFGPKMKKIVEEVEVQSFPKLSEPGCRGIIIHCWRGGMRSGAISWLLDLYGYKVYSLIGGYKAYRKWIQKQLEEEYEFNILGGYTGSGKTFVLKRLAELGESIIDLEQLAKHKGSAFGALGEIEAQPRPEMFENILGNRLYLASVIEKEENKRYRIWVEDESQRIGSLNIPPSIWKQMRMAPIYFLDIAFEVRLKYLVDSYGNHDAEKLVGAITRIQKRLGGLETKNAITFLKENKIKECFTILLHYYDKHYDKGLHNRNNLENLLATITCDRIDPLKNADKIKAYFYASDTQRPNQ